MIVNSAIYVDGRRAAEAKTAVWDLISRLLNDPERVRAGLDEMIEQERAGMCGDPDREAASWLEKLSEDEQERCRYLHFAAKAHMADEGLDETLDQTRMMAEAAAH
jgi:hypothetical protein